jgi:threonine synthase
MNQPWRGVIEEYRDLLPVSESTPVVTLLEGNTPLLDAPSVAQRAGVARVWLKVEGLNPTASFKDRGMTMAMSVAVERGAKLAICASTGKTSASAAAYAARAGLSWGVVLPAGRIALGKVAQALIHGAHLVPIHGNFDDALTIVRELGKRPGVEVVNSVNEFRIEGQKTASFEVVDTLGDAPTVHCLPVGNAGNITAYWRGYTEYHALGRATRLPRMLGWQAAGSAPIVLGEPVLHPETIATAIEIGNPASWAGAVAARDASGGHIGAITDAQILDGYRFLASEEGCFVELRFLPARAAAARAGRRTCVAQGRRAAAARPRADGARQ